MTEEAQIEKRLSIWKGWPLTTVTGATKAPQALNPDDEAQHRDPTDPEDFDSEVDGDEIGVDRRAALARRRDDQSRALAALAKMHPGFIAGTEPPMWNDREMRSAFLEVCKTLSTVRERETFNFLVKGTEALVRAKGWDLPIPAPITEVRNTASAFMPTTFQTLPAVGRLREAVLKAATDPGFYARKNNAYLERAHDSRRKKRARTWTTLQGLHLGQILASVVLFGGAVSRPLTNAILEALAGGPRIHGDLLWLPLSVRPHSGRRQAERLGIEPEEGSDPEIERRLFRRYFPDPLSGLLILKYVRTYPEHLEIEYQHLDELLRFYLASINHGLESTPNLAALIQISLQHAALLMPASLVEYASNILWARSVPEDTWVRIRRRLAAPMGQSAADHASPIGRRTNITRADGYPDQHAELIKLRNQLPTLGQAAREKDPDKARALEAEIAWDNFCPMLYAIGQWCRYLATPRSSGGRNLRISSLRTYLSRVGKRLLVHGLEFDLNGAEEEDFNELYSLVLDNIDDPINRQGVNKRLTDFHRFLVRRIGAPPVEMVRGPADFSSVDANFITETEYQHAMKLLQERRGPSQAAKVAQRLILLLGYRAGLRRSEAKYLRLTDVQIEQTRSGDLLSVELTLRSHSMRRLKTRHAQRRLPLDVLLTADELTEFVDYVRLRRSEQDSNAHELLFARRGPGRSPLDDDETFTPIRLALRAATGDANVRFHHLRHSFANLLLLRLWRIRHPETFTDTWAPFLKDLPFDESDDQGLWRALVGDDLQSPTRKLLYAVSTAMGHADPASTLANYWHFFDIALGGFLHHCAPDASVEAQAMLLDIPVPLLRVERSKAGIDHKQLVHAFSLAKRRARLKWPEPPPDGATKYRPGRLPPEVEAADNCSWASLLTVNRALEAFQASPPDDGFSARCRSAAAAVGCSHTEVELWLHAANNLTRVDGPRRSMNHRGPDGTTPRPPRTRAQRREAVEIYNNLMRCATDPGRGPDARLAILYFVYSGNASDISIHAKDSDAALMMAECFRMSGIDPKRIRIRICGGRTDHPRRIAAAWADYLGLPGLRLLDRAPDDGENPPRLFKLRENPQRPPDAPRGVTFYISRKGKSRPASRNDRSQNEFRPIRYAFQMAAIASDALNEVPAWPRDSRKLPDELSRRLKTYARSKPKVGTKSYAAERMGQQSMEL